MKKLILISLFLAVTTIAANAAWLTTNLNAGAGIGGNFVLLSGDYKVESIQAITGNPASMLLFRDWDNADTNSHFAAYNSLSSYTTNIVTSYVATTGITNTYTNSGVYTFTNTVAAGSNAIPVIYTLSIPASTTSDVFTPDLNLSKGLTVSTTGTNVTLLIKYRNLFN